MKNKSQINKIRIMSKLDEMCYSEFIDYLDSKKIDYQEGVFVDSDFWMEEYVKIVPLNTKKLKERYFSTDGGGQLFDNIPANFI